MKPVEFYRYRQQTYVKHLFLERYLERVAYNIGSFKSEFVYVDGFSGPWRSNDEKYGDTSFGIAIETLRKVQQGLHERGRQFNARCLFIEKSPKAYSELLAETSRVSDMEVVAVNGEFEGVISEIIKFVGASFSLVFVDPTGWTGFGLDKISSLLRLRGEVLVNFMYNDINRHLEDPRPNVAESFSPLFGGVGWQEDVSSLISRGDSREDAVVETYRKRFKAAGNFPYATTTRILNPLSDRTYFYLIYGTRHWKGLYEFRRVEKSIVDKQELVRDAAKLDYRVQRTGQNEFSFGPSDLGVSSMSFKEERARQCDLACASLMETIKKQDSSKYEDILAQALESRLVWESDVRDWLMQARAAGDIDIEGLKPRERTLKAGHRIRWCDH